MPPTVQGPGVGGRFDVLDGWRGISILLVLATHMLPLGPKAWRLNETSGPLGMSLFFTLSGFLITTTLIKHGHVLDFFIRRFFRIVPLGYLYLLLVLPFVATDLATWESHLTFSVNYLTDHFSPLTLHLWSLCVEIHFYAAIGILFAIGRRRGLMLLPWLMVAITLAKICLHPDVQMQTHLRGDEILGGCMLSLLYHEGNMGRIRRILATIPLVVSAGVLIATCHPNLHAFQWLRPYAAIAVVGHTLYNSEGFMIPLLSARCLRYVADISYALYVIHPVTMAGWLGAGSGWEKYLKRPISIALSFGLAHLSTYRFEHRLIELGKRLVRRRQRTHRELAGYAQE
jgi:peptidoglycan/LPS O-acetylase OafA/YrhL